MTGTLSAGEYHPAAMSAAAWIRAHSVAERDGEVQPSKSMAKRHKALRSGRE